MTAATLTVATSSRGEGAAPADAKPSVTADVFQIASGWFPEHKGGAESVMHNICTHIGGHGFSVSGVVAGTSRVEADTSNRIHSFSTVGRSPLGRIRGLRRAARASFAQREPDLVAGHFALYTAPVLDMIHRLPMVVHFHGPWALESKVEGGARGSVAMKRAIEQLVYRRARRVIVLSKAFGDLVQSEYGVDGALVRQVPGGIDCDRFDLPETRQEARRILGWDPDRPAIFTARRLVRRMGLDKLVAAIAAVRGEPGGGDVVLHIAGSGPARAELEKQVADLGLTDCVRLHGFVPDDRLALAYRAADLTLVPTAALEGFGLVAAESLAAGTPVLVTPVGGLPEVVSGLSEHCVLAGTDIGSIADGLLQFLRDPTLFPDGQTCSDFARRRYDWPVVIQQVAEVYREALQ